MKNIKPIASSSQHSTINWICSAYKAKTGDTSVICYSWLLVFKIYQTMQIFFINEHYWSHALWCGWIARIFPILWKLCRWILALLKKRALMQLYALQRCGWIYNGRWQTGARQPSNSPITLLQYSISFLSSFFINNDISFIFYFLLWK